MVRISKSLHSVPLTSARSPSPFVTHNHYSIDPFLKKEWYKLVAPSIFATKDCGKTIITKTQGTKIETEGLKGRICEFNLADLNGDASKKSIGMQS